MELIGSIRLLIAGILGVMVFVVGREVLKQCPILDNPMISLCVAVLTVIGLLGIARDGFFNGLLIPYEALGITVPLILILPLFKLRKRRLVEKNQEGIVKAKSRKEIET